MAETPQGSVEVTTGFGSLKLGGANAMGFFLMVCVIGVIAVTLWENVQRSTEHDQIMCTTKLAIFIYTTPRDPGGKIEIDWSKLDVSLYSCVPKWLYTRN